ncbi:MAG TPA: WD40 repeat domain-containing protein [Flavobacteriales bacterium]|nr:WD40 repeat domain-containing protein [Flavobacteriales bacterium]
MLPSTVFPGTVRFTGHRGPVYILCPEARPGRFLSGSGDGSVVRWNIHEPGTGTIVAKAGRAIFAMHHPRPQALYLGDEDGGLHVVDLERREEVQLVKAHAKGLFALASLPDGRLVTAGGDGEISVWLPREGGTLPVRRQRSIPLTDEKVRSLAPSLDGTLLTVACGDGRIHILDTAELNEQFTLPGHEIGANSLAWHPDKPVLVSGGKDGHIRLWHAGDGFRPLHAFPAHKDAIYQIAFSPNGALLASAGRDKTAKLWDAATFGPIRRLDRHHGGHGYSVNTVAWLDDRPLLTASDDKSIVAWEVAPQG